MREDSYFYRDPDPLLALISPDAVLRLIEMQAATRVDWPKSWLPLRAEEARDD